MCPNEPHVQNASDKSEKNHKCIKGKHQKAQNNGSEHRTGVDDEEESSYPFEKFYY